MYFSSVGGNFLKAQVQNHYEKVRCSLYLKDISKRHIHSLTNINKSIRETRDALRDIRASSGYCDKVRGNEVLSRSKVWKEREWSLGMSRPNEEDQGRRQAGRRTSAFQEINSKNLDSGEPIVSKTIVEGVNTLHHEKSECNVVEQIENFVRSAGGGNAGSEVNGDIVQTGGLLTDEIRTLPDSRNVSSKRPPTRQGMASTVSAKSVNEPRGISQVKSISPANGSNVQDSTSAKLTGRSSELVTSRIDEPLEFAIRSAKLGKSKPNTNSAGLMGPRSHTAPAKASHIKSAPAKGELKKASSSRYLSANDVKVKIHVSLSRMERKRLLQELISSCAVPCDRSALERQRQRLLQEKIDRFFELLFEQDDKYDEDGESDSFSDN